MQSGSKVGEVASFGTYLKFTVERPNIKLKSTACPHGIFEIVHDQKL